LCFARRLLTHRVSLRPSAACANARSSDRSHHSNRPTAGPLTALVPSRPPDLHYYDSQRSPSAASTLISWSGLATRAKTQYRTPCCLSLHAPSINHSSLSKPASFRSCGSDLRHISLPLDRSVLCCPKPNHWTLPTFTSFTCDSEVHIPTPPSAQALSNLPARSLSHSSYGHRVIPLSTSLEHPNLRNTTRLPWSRACLHTPSQPSSLIFSTFPHLHQPGPLQHAPIASQTLDTH